MTATSTEKRHGRIKQVSKVIRALHDSGVPGFTPEDISYRCNLKSPNTASRLIAGILEDPEMQDIRVVRYEPGKYRFEREEEMAKDVGESMTEEQNYPVPRNGSLICTRYDCPEGKFDCKVLGHDYTTDICFDMSVDGKNAHDCLELCTTGYQGLFCPKGFRQ